ncbi:MAG: hypothetical protein AAGF15_08055 [Pseudomonadota bacterium]
MIDGEDFDDWTLFASPDPLRRGGAACRSDLIDLVPLRQSQSAGTMLTMVRSLGGMPEAVRACEVGLAAARARIEMELEDSSEPEVILKATIARLKELFGPKAAFILNDCAVVIAHVNTEGLMWASRGALFVYLAQDGYLRQINTSLKDANITPHPRSKRDGITPSTAEPEHVDRPGARLHLRPGDAVVVTDHPLSGLKDMSILTLPQHHGGDSGLTFGHRLRNFVIETQKAAPCLACYVHEPAADRIGDIAVFGDKPTALKTASAAAAAMLVGISALLFTLLA